MSRSSSRAVALGAGAALVLGGLAAVPPASADPSRTACDQRALRTTQQLLACVGAESSVVHLEALQRVADANGGTRASGTPGYRASVDYVSGLLEDAGYDVTVQPFDFFFYDDENDRHGRYDRHDGDVRPKVRFHRPLRHSVKGQPFHTLLP